MDSTQKKVPISIILPCYNPLSNWTDTILDSIEEIKNRLPYLEIELIVVNDGSTKNISELQVQKLKENIPEFQYITYPSNKGKGYALRQGIKVANKELCIYTDIDFPYMADSFVGMFEQLQTSSLDLVVGVRDAKYYEHVPLVRKWISKLLRFFIRLFLRMEISDTQCGIKGFSKKGREIFLKTEINRYLFDMEFVFLASHAPGIRVTPFEVTLKPGIVFSKVNLKILLTEGLSFIKLIFKSIFRENK